MTSDRLRTLCCYIRCMEPPRAPYEPAPFVRAAAAANLTSFLQRHGIEPQPLFRQLGLDLDSVRDPYASMQLSSFTELMKLVAEETGIASTGLQLGFEQDPANWGALGFVLLNAPTVWECLSALERFLPPWQSGTHAKAVRDRDFMRIEYAILHPAVRHRDQDAEFSLSFTANQIRRMSGGLAAPVHASFMHPQVAETSAYEKYLGVRPIFDADVNSLHYERRAGDLENLAADHRLYYVISKHLEDLIEELPKTQTLVDSVKELVRVRLSGKPPSLAAISQLLAVQQRTLQRRLDAQGVSFSDLISQVREEEARRYLEDTSTEVKEISYFLGFSDPSAFIKAFKRSTGLTPIAYRERHRADKA